MRKIYKDTDLTELKDKIKNIKAISFLLEDNTYEEIRLSKWDYEAIEIRDNKIYAYDSEQRTSCYFDNKINEYVFEWFGEVKIIKCFFNLRYYKQGL